MGPTVDTTLDFTTLLSRRGKPPPPPPPTRIQILEFTMSIQTAPAIANHCWAPPLLTAAPPLCLLRRTSSRPPWTGRGRGSEVSRSRPPPGSARTWSPWRPRPWSCTRWSGRRAAPPSPWWRRTSSTCRRRSERGGAQDRAFIFLKRASPGLDLATAFGLGRGLPARLQCGKPRKDIKFTKKRKSVPESMSSTH